jgi:membrane associated rhomboid family serine protease
MGLYDREYYRDSCQVRFVNPLGPRWQTSGTFWLIAINVGVFFVQLILQRFYDDRILVCTPAAVIEDFQAWRLVTAAFCHDTQSLWHLFFNMLVLFFFGPPIERLYGRRDFIAFYLMVAVVANLAYCAVPYVLGGDAERPVVGASGCCMAIVVLTAFYYPRQTVIFIFIPVPLWLLAGFFVASDLFGFLQARPGARVAYVVHLTGAALGALSYLVDLRLTTILARLGRLMPRRRVRRYEVPGSRMPPDGIPRFLEDIEAQKLDRILEKISRFGRESLNDEEVEFLNRMSDRYRGRR